MAHFSEDSGESSNQEDDYESEAGDSEERDDELIYIDDALERRHSSGRLSSVFAVGQVIHCEILFCFARYGRVRRFIGE